MFDSFPIFFFTSVSQKYSMKYLLGFITGEDFLSTQLKFPTLCLQPIISMKIDLLQLCRVFNNRMKGLPEKSRPDVKGEFFIFVVNIMAR